MTRPFPRSRRPVGAAALSVFLLLASACGSSSNTDTDAVASLDDDNGPSETDASADDEPALEAPDDPEDAFALYGECMTDAGFGFGGSFAIGGPGADAIDVTELDEQVDPSETDPQQAGSFDDLDPEAFEEANAQCEGHLDGIDAGFDLSPEEQAAFDDAQLEFTECMEEQGVDMPEITTGGAGMVTVEEVEIDPESGEPSFDDLDFDIAAFEEAAEPCQHILEELEPTTGGTGE